MNLALHGLFFQVIVSIVQLQHGFRLCSAGEPGYLDFDNLPETNFSCQGKVIGGYYADVEAGCQMFHVCTIGQKDEIMDIKFLCLNGTVFDQETRVCERVDEVDCSKSERFYNLNLELYGNNAVTLSLHDTEDDDDPIDLEDHESQRTTSSRPTSTSSTTTTTPRPSISSTTQSSGSYQHSNGYPQHFQPQPRFPSVQTSQSKSLYDDKNGGYHHQYIYHTGDHRNNNVDTNNDPNNQNHNSNNQATSYQLFSNQGVSSTTGAPQIHQVRYSSTPSTQIQIHNDHQPTVSPIFHATSSTIQTLLNSNANSPALINPIFHNHGIASTTEQFTVHNNNPREADEYRDDEEGDERNEESRRPLEAIQPTTQGKVSKLTISPPQEDTDRSGQQSKSNQQQQQQRITTSFLPTPASDDGQALRSFYPTPRTSTKSSSSHVTHIHLPPPPAIPQLKPHQVTINLPPPDIQRIVQNPSPLLPSQSRVIVTAKASVSDESGRPLNSTQLVTLPLPTIPASYDDYKEGDVSFDPFYRDVPKVRNGRRIAGQFRWTEEEFREKRSLRIKRDVEEVQKKEIKAEESTVGKEMAKVEAEGNANDDKSQDLIKKHDIDPNSEDKVDEKTVIKTKESDEGEYVDSDDAKTALDTKEMDAEEYTNTEDDAIDSKIFDEPESQTSKEIDVRAVDQQDSKYSKDRSNRLEKEDKDSKNENFNSLGNSKKPDDNFSRFSLLPEVSDMKPSGKHSSKQLKDEISAKEEEVDEENYEENLPDEDYYYYDEEINDSSLQSNEEDSVEHSKESPNKIEPSSKHKSSHRNKSLKSDDAKEDEDYDVTDDATTRSNEQAASYEMSDEYADGDQANASPEDSREMQDDEAPTTNDNTTQEFVEEATSSTEQIESSEATTAADKKMHEKHLSEGVLKFTDEIPSSEKTDVPEESERSESAEETPQDYIDDNYEPQSYKEQKVSSTTMATITTEKITEETNSPATEDANDATTEMSPLDVAKEMQEKQNDQPRVENKSEAEPLEQSIEKPIENEEDLPMTIAIITTSSTTTPATTTTTIPTITTTMPTITTTMPTITTTMPTITTTMPTTTTTTMPTSTTTMPTTTTTASTTTPAATTTTSTTTPATTTTTTRSTTARPTPPKLFKPFTIRKSYVYIPPTTTPVPVKIKPRLHLLNPKPAKPPKSYNDLAPKPVIRKSPLFARKALIARTTTPYEIKNLEDSTEVPVQTTEIRKIEEITPSPTTTEVPTTQAAESSSQVATTLPDVKQDENLSIKDNNVPISITDSLQVSSATESQTFTPYPILRMTEATATVEKEAKELFKDVSTTERPFVESNDVPNVNEAETSSRTPETITAATLERDSSSTTDPSSTVEPQKTELPIIEPTSDSAMLQNNLASDNPDSDVQPSTSIAAGSDEATTEIIEAINRTPTLASIKAVNRRPGAVKRNAFFNCLEKEMYRFYADGRDCRLFHYCSPGFTSRQVLDFRFVCEEGTAFDEETQSCVHDVKSPKCRKRVW